MKLLKLASVFVILVLAVCQFSPEEEKLMQHIKETLDSHLLEG